MKSCSEKVFGEALCSSAPFAARPLLLSGRMEDPQLCFPLDKAPQVLPCVCEAIANPRYVFVDPLFESFSQSAKTSSATDQTEAKL